MASSLVHFVRRGDMPQLSTMGILLLVLLVLVLVAVVLVVALLFMRQRRKAFKASELPPPYREKRISASSTPSYHRRINVRPSQSIHIFQDKQAVEDSFDPPSPTSPLPEIRITFPEEVDSSGKWQSGRVVVVHVGDSGVGLEPVTEKIPAYQQSQGERFQSLDLERMGGLFEKDTRPPHAW